MLRPLGDRVLVSLDEKETMIGSVYLPEHIVEKPKQGTVVAVGLGTVNTDGTRTAPDVRVGDHVLFSQYGGIDVELGSTSYVVLREGDMLGVIDDEAVKAAERAAAVEPVESIQDAAERVGREVEGG